MTGRVHDLRVATGLTLDDALAERTARHAAGVAGAGAGSGRSRGSSGCQLRWGYGSWLQLRWCFEVVLRLGRDTQYLARVDVVGPVHLGAIPPVDRRPVGAIVIDMPGY